MEQAVELCKSAQSHIHPPACCRSQNFGMRFSTESSTVIRCCASCHRDLRFDGSATLPRRGTVKQARAQARPTFSLEHQMRLALATAFALIVLPATALSQGVTIDALSLQSGARARILGPTADSKYELITVASASPDSLRYSLDPSLAIKSLAWQQISKMDASIGRHTNVGRGAGIGFLVGLIGGAALAAHQSWGGTRDYNELRALGIVASGLTMGAL